jgi:3-hydroxyacyl-CoA dehydrogenase
MAFEGLKVDERDGVRLLTLANPPSNALIPVLRATLVAALALPPAGCSRVVILAAGATFSSALPLDPDPGLPGLAAVCSAVEASALPVIAALHGLVIGPGAEVAVAARMRIAAPGTRIGFPEVALGLGPEGGTTRRLAARLGMAAALRLLLSGRAVPADEALALGLIDAIHDDPVAAAQTVAVLQGPPALPQTDAAAIAEARRAHLKALPAVGRIIACVEAAALLPPEAHLAFEAVAREDLEASAEARALRAVARAERRAAAFPAGIVRLKPVAPDRIALHGTGPDITTLARLALARGLLVAWHHPDLKAEAANLAALDRAEAAEQRAGRLTATLRAAGRTRLLTGGDAPLHIHADPVEERQNQDSEVHLCLGGDDGTLGLALSPQMTTCEVSLPGTPPVEAVAVALATLRRLGMLPVLVGRRPILGRGLVTAGRTALAWMTAAGVPRLKIAVAMESFGVRSPDDLPDSDAARRDLGPDEILARWLGALANEGLRMLDQGIARRPSDVDLVLVSGHGFPRWQGGPMHQAGRRGLMALRADLRRWAEDDPLWSPAPLLDRLIRDGITLDALDVAV